MKHKIQDQPNNCDVGMKLKIIKANENSENKATFPEDQKEYDVITQKIQDLTQGIRSFLKDGKITIHSVMTTWVGSPFGAVEAFKKSDINQDEIETKFSCTIFDVIEIISNLQREDPIAFWVGGKKNMAMKHLIPLATDSVRLCHKLQRITTTLEGYSMNLQKTAAALQVLDKKPIGPPEISCLLKHPKSGNCYRFRKAFRHAWYSLSGYEKKAITEAPPLEDSCKESPERAQSTPKDPAAFMHMRNEVRTPERNKSDSAQRNKGCNAFNGFCQCPAYFCQKFDYQPRLRNVPSFIFIPQPIQYHCKHQDCNCNCCDNNPAGDVQQCPCQCQCCQHQQQETQEADEKSPDTVSAQVPPGNQESQPFEVTTEGYETSYLKDYEKNCHCQNQNQKVASENGNPTKNISDVKIGAPTEYTEINAIDPDNGNLDNNCNNTEEEVIKEVVIVRSAVSDFAESEYGAIDSEDMEWLEKIKDMGQTGNICAEEIEQSERLKRQSIFLNCIRFRTEETFKDLQSVLKMVRATESRWVDPTESNQATEESPTDIRRLELQEIVSEIDKYCRRLVPKNIARGKSRVDKSQVEPIGQLVLSVQGEVAGVHKSFQRFTKMVKNDANFLKQLCMGFSPRELSLEEELRQSGKPVPNYLCMPMKEGDQSVLEIQPEVDFREIFDGEL
ncbi:unnamed protein product [Allacma fusca]|uniref:Uncharacterized protein n=1 Tax=Allacma fusca TaxID=39272 RepID=A0A8J2LGI7_9HEXA|nr:unnamed protein product [Allacma fusca]